MYDPFENMMLDINGMKTNMITNIYTFLEFHQASLEIFSDIIYRILNCDTEEELLALEYDLEVDDTALEVILGKTKISRIDVIEKLISTPHCLN